MEEDHHYIQAFQAGDTQAYKHLYKKYIKSLIHFLKRHMGAENEDVIDLAQEIMVKIYKNLDNFQYKSTFATYMFTTALNQVRNYRRNKVHQAEPTEDANFEHTHKKYSEKPTEENAIKSNLEKTVQSAISSLPEPDRTVILLKTMQRLTLSEIAKIVGESDRNTHYIKERAEKKIRIFLEKRGVSPEDTL